MVSKLTTPTVREDPVARARAMALGRKSSCAAAASTLARVSALTRGWSLNTRDTVWCETPASSATSRSPGRPPPRTASAVRTRSLVT